MRFFSRLVAICNVCFIITVIMRYVEQSDARKGEGEVMRLPFIQNTLVVLGYSAIILNVVFVLITLYFLIANKLNRLPRSLLIFNLIVFAWQVIFHFDLF